MPDRRLRRRAAASAAGGVAWVDGRDLAGRFAVLVEQRATRRRRVDGAHRPPTPTRVISAISSPLGPGDSSARHVAAGTSSSGSSRSSVERGPRRRPRARPRARARNGSAAADSSGRRMSARPPGTRCTRSLSDATASTMRSRCGDEVLLEVVDVGLEEVAPCQQCLDLALDLHPLGLAGPTGVGLGRFDERLGLGAGLVEALRRVVAGGAEQCGRPLPAPRRPWCRPCAGPAATCG